MPEIKNQDLNPQNGAGGSSYIYYYGTSPNTRVAVNQKVRILTPHYGNSQALHQMGVLGTFSPSQSKSIEEMRGIGFGDKVAELVPSITAAMTVNTERAMMYLCNLWQATGYASGVDGPVRSVAHHRWPFDVEQQLVFSTLADADLGVANVGLGGQSGTFNGGVKQISFPQTTFEGSRPGFDASNRGHSALITMYEACWWTQVNASYAKEAAAIMESGDFTVTDVHDFASVYGEFLASGNDPTIGQLGSIRFAGNGFQIGQAGRGLGGGGTVSQFVQAG